MLLCNDGDCYGLQRQAPSGLFCLDLFTLVPQTSLTSHTGGGKHELMDMEPFTSLLVLFVFGSVLGGTRLRGDMASLCSCIDILFFCWCIYAFSRTHGFLVHLHLLIQSESSVHPLSSRPCPSEQFWSQSPNVVTLVLSLLILKKAG